MIISFFGHSNFRRDPKYERKLLNCLYEKVGDRLAYMYFGGYGEFDDFAYECCKKYKQTHPNVVLVFLTPYITLENQRNHLDCRKTQYDEIIYPEIERRPLKYAILYRNQWMAEQADLSIFAVKHSWGGAYKAYQYAIKKKKSVFNLIDSKF